MDNNSIAILQDYQSSIEGSFKKIERLFNEALGADQSQQNLAMNNIKTEINSAKNNIGLCKFETANLKEEGNATKWNEIMAEMNSKLNGFKIRLEQLNRGGNNNNNIENDYLNVDAKVDLSKLTSQQAMDRGDEILRQDKNALNRMKKVVTNDLDTMKEVNRELLNQQEKLENAENDLKEIDYSLNRAGKQLKTMAKMIATDKLIMCMICCILLVIVAIIIVSVFFSDDDDENAKQDTFQND